MSQLWLTIITVMGTLFAAYLGYWLIGKPRLYVFSPNSTGFQLPAPEGSGQPIAIRAGQVIVQNGGRKSANKVQLMAQPGPLPWGYTIVPNINHQILSGPKGEWLMEIPYIGPREVVTVQILNGPNIDTVRSLEGPAKVLDVIHQRLFPKWVNWVVGSLMLLGLGTVAYGIIVLLAVLFA
jgi:hypothetical protein